MKKTLIAIGLLLSMLVVVGCRNGESDGDADVDGDADADGGDLDGDTDGDATTGCYPPIGICDVVARCGCEAGQHCDVSFQYDGTNAWTEVACVGDTGGTGVHGDEGCSNGTCAPGFFCSQEADATGSPVTVCRKWCLEEEDCAEYPGSHCSRELCYVDADDNPLGCIEPYLACTPEDVGLGAGSATFTICRGLPDQCPGGTRFTTAYEIRGGAVNGRCDINRSVSPAELTFNLRDTDPSISVTANRILFDFEAASAGFTRGSSTERTRFTFILPPDNETFSTTSLAHPPSVGTCAVEVRYRADDEGFDLNFTCNHVGTTWTDEQIVTIDGEMMGPGTLSMDGCLVTG